MIYMIEGNKTIKDEFLNYAKSYKDSVIRLFPHYGEMQGGWVEVIYKNGMFMSFLAGPFGEETQQYNSKNFDLILQNAKMIIQKVVVAEVIRR